MLTISMPDLVAVEHGLHQLTQRGAIWSRSSASAESMLHLADHLAHRSLGGLHHGLGRLVALEQEGARVLQPVLHREVDLDDVLVLRSASPSPAGRSPATTRRGRRRPERIWVTITVSCAGSDTAGASGSRHPPCGCSGRTG